MSFVFETRVGIKRSKLLLTYYPGSLLRSRTVLPSKVGVSVQVENVLWFFLTQCNHQSLAEIMFNLLQLLLVALLLMIAMFIDSQLREISH